MIRWATFALVVFMLVATGCGSGEAEPPFDPDFPEIKCNHSFSYRYRVTAVVDTPEGPRSGSSVNEVRVRRYGGGSLTHPCGMHSYGKGEAVAVDLGGKGHLFVLLTGEHYSDWFVDAPVHIVNARLQEVDPERVHSYEGAWQIAETTGRAWEVPSVAMTAPSYFEPYGRIAGRMPHHMATAYAWEGRAMRPFFVRYGDEKDWRTVERLDPDRLEDAYGPGYALRSLTIQATDAPLTEGRIDRLLPWVIRSGNISPVEPSNGNAEENWERIPFHHRLRHYDTGSLKDGRILK